MIYSILFCPCVAAALQGQNTGQLQGQIQAPVFLCGSAWAAEERADAVVDLGVRGIPVALIAGRPGGCPASGVRPDAGQVTTAAW
jgi:hypothetical protein